MLKIKWMISSEPWYIIQIYHGLFHFSENPRINSAHISICPLTVRSAPDLSLVSSNSLISSKGLAGFSLLSVSDLCLLRKCFFSAFNSLNLRGLFFLSWRWHSAQIHPKNSDSWEILVSKIRKFVHNLRIFHYSYASNMSGTFYPEER